jgi:uncharacterized phage protein gp47/JayE
MPFPIPALADLVQRSRAAFRNYLPGSDAWLWPNNLNPAAKVIAGMTFEVFGFADYICKQKFAITADGDNLDLHGAELGLARRPAQPSGGNVIITSTNGALSVAAAAQFARADGVLIVAQQSGSLSASGALSLAVEAAAGGQNTTTIAGTELTPISGLTGPGAATATIAVDQDGLAGGMNVELDGEPYTTDLSTFRGRILFRKRNPPFGGCPADYVQWCTNVPGVTRVFVERLWNGPGTVRVFPVMDDLYAATGGVPGPADIARVIDYLAGVQPSDALVTVQAPSPVTVDLTVQGLRPGTTDVEEGVLGELRASFRRNSRVAGNDVYFPSMPYLAHPTSYALQWLWGALNDAAGETRAKLVLPNADIPLGAGQFPVLGNLTFM